MSAEARIGSGAAASFGAVIAFGSESGVVSFGADVAVEPSVCFGLFDGAASFGARGHRHLRRIAVNQLLTVVYEKS